MCAVDLHIAERYPCAKSRAERLEHRFLGSKSSRQSLDPIDPLTDLIQFGLSKASRNQRVSRILDPAPHLGDVHQVNAMSDDVHKIHLSVSPIYEKVSNIRDREE